MRCVLDTNVLVSAVLLPNSVPRKVLDCVLLRGTLLISYPVVSELDDVLMRPRFKRYIDEEDGRRFIAALSREAEWIDVGVQVQVCRDPKDNKVLELGISGQASHIVSGDADLLVLHPFQGITIIAPQPFLQECLSAH